MYNDGITMKTRMMLRIFLCLVLNVSGVVFGAEKSSFPEDKRDYDKYCDQSRELSLLQKNQVNNLPKPIKLSLDLLRSYDDIDCFLPIDVSNAVPAIIAIRPRTNGSALDIIPRNKPYNESLDNNPYALELDVKMMDSISSRIELLCKNNPNAQRCVVSLTENVNIKKTKLLYEIDIKQYCEFYRDLLKVAEYRQKGVALAFEKREEAERQDAQEKLLQIEEEVRKKWDIYKNVRIEQTMQNLIIECLHYNKLPSSPCQEARLIIAQDCYYLIDAKDGALLESWLGVPMAIPTLTNIRRWGKQESFYMHAVKINIGKSDHTVRDVVKIVEVVDKAPDVSSYKIMWGSEEPMVKKSSLSFKNIALLSLSAVAFGYALYQAGKLPESLMHFFDMLLPARFLR